MSGLSAESRSQASAGHDEGPLRAIDLFAGVGGSSAGATAAGIKVVAAVDCWALARDTYKANFQDVQFFDSKCEDVPIRKLKRQLGTVDVLLASPECTSHTCAKGSAPRSELSRRTAFQVTRFARAFKPRWIVVENVVHMRSWRSYKRWLKTLKELGYKIREQIINAAEHGVPQARRRLFVICDLEQMPPKVGGRPGRRRTAASIIDKNGTYKFSALRKKKRAAATLERADRALAELGQEKPFLIVYYGSDQAGGWQSVNAPLRTLTTLDRFALVTPTADGHRMRMLQVPEIRTAMGFRDDHVLPHGNRRDKIKLLGNAVCPPVMAAVLRSLTGGRA